MSLPTSTNDVTARKLSSVIDGLWTKSKSTFVKKAGDTMIGRLTLEKPLNQVLIGTGIAASSSGSPTTYYPARWKYDLGIANPTQGDQMVIKLPCAGSDYGCFISTDNGTTYYPVARHVGANRHTTHYGNGSYICVVFEAYVNGNSNAGQVNDIFPAAGGTARTSLKIGCWRIINDYDSGNTVCQLRTENGRFYAGSTGCKPYSLVCLDKAGKYSMLVSSGSGTGTSKTINTAGKFKLDAVILYYSANNTTAANALVSSTYATYYAITAIDTRYSHNHTTTFTTNSPVYIECTIDSDGYWSPTTKCITQTLETGKYYIYLGQTYSTEYQISLLPSHPLYYYDGTNLTERPRLNSDDRAKLDGISAGANKVEASSTNGKIKIDGTDTTVYAHPTQTAYSAKGSATKVPKITTDSTGHVTSIEEVTISGVTPASHSHGNIANGGTLTDTAAAAAGNDYVVIRDADNAKIQTSTIKGTDVADAISKKHSHSTLTLSTTAQAYDGTHTLALPSSDPYTSARTPASHAHGNIANGGTLTDTAAAATGNDYVVIRDADNAKIQTSTIKGTDVADAVSKKHSHSTLTLSTTAQAYDGSHTLALPSTDPYTSARTPASHTHGNITNGGALQTNDISIASGDKLVVTDASDSNKVARTSVSFDGSTTTKALTQKGTFEAFAKAGDITTAIQALDVSSVGGDGKYISAISEADGKISATATTMDTAPTASSTKAVTSEGIKTALDKKVDIANASLEGQSTTILAQVQSLASNQIHYKRFYTTSDGGSANISDKPTGTSNAGFVLEAYCNRYVSSSDWRYVVLCYVQASRPKIAWIKSGDTSISWQDLNTNTDTKVTQTADNSSTGTGFEVLFSATADNTTRTEASRKSSKLTFQPSTGTLTATKFSGPLTGNVTGNCSGSSGSCTGNAATATTATNANITRTADTTNGDKLQIGTGTAVNITNAKHAASADSATSAAKVANKLTLKIKTGTTEGTDLYTYDGSGAKTLDIKQGSNITLTAAAGSLTIAGTADTKNTAGSTDTSSKIFLIGATSQAANPLTYSQDTTYVDTDATLASTKVRVAEKCTLQFNTNTNALDFVFA